MRIKFTDTVESKEEFKKMFCDMIEKLPFDIDECMLSGINLYFNIKDKDTKSPLEYIHEDEVVNCLTYGTKKKTKKIKSKTIKEDKTETNNNGAKIHYMKSV